MVKPILSTDVFSRVNWPNSPITVRRRHVVRQYKNLDDPALAVPAPIPAIWEEFANTVSQTRDALLTEVSLNTYHISSNKRSLPDKHPLVFVAKTLIIIALLQQQNVTSKIFLKIK